MPPLLRPRVFTRNEETAVSPQDLPIDGSSYEPVAPEDYRDEMPVLGGRAVVETVDSYVPLNIRIPQYLYDEYRRVAAAQDLSVEEVIQHRVEACRLHNALRGLWFSDSERGQLENLIQKWPLETATQVLNLISKAASVHFDDIQVSLTPAQKRVLSLAMFGGRTPKSFFEALVRKELRT